MISRRSHISFHNAWNRSMIACTTVLLSSCVWRFSCLISLLNLLLLHTYLEQHLLLCQVLLLAHVLLLATNLLGAFWLHHLLLGNLLLAKLLLCCLIGIVLLELLHQQELLLFGQVFVLSSSQLLHTMDLIGRGGVAWIALQVARGDVLGWNLAGLVGVHLGGCTRGRVCDKLLVLSSFVLNVYIWRWLSLLIGRNSTLCWDYLLTFLLRQLLQAFLLIAESTRVHAVFVRAKSAVLSTPSPRKVVQSLLDLNLEIRASVVHLLGRGIEKLILAFGLEIIILASECFHLCLVVGASRSRWSSLTILIGILTLLCSLHCCLSVCSLPTLQLLLVLYVLGSLISWPSMTCGSWILNLLKVAFCLGSWIVCIHWLWTLLIRYICELCVQGFL